MVTDPPPDEEDPAQAAGDGSADEDPIEEVDFWEEVGETRPTREEDLSGGTGAPDPGPDADDEVPPEPGDRWPGLDTGDPGPEDVPGASEPDDPGRPSSEIDAEDRLSEGAKPRGLDLGLGPEEGEPEASDGPTPDEPELEEPEVPAPPEDPDGDPEARAPDEGSAGKAEGEIDGAAPEGAGAPEPEARAPDEAAGPDGGPSPDGAEPEVPRLRERGPIEAEAHPREGVEEAEGPCHLCGEDGDERARYTCVSCEEPACASHLWIMFGLCEGCATEDQIRKLRGERTEDDWSAFLGIKWVD